MTILKTMRKIDVETGQRQDVNEYLAENGIPPLPGIQKIWYRMATNDLYGKVVVDTVFGEEEKWFWFSDSDQEWKSITHSPY